MQGAVPLSLIPDVDPDELDLVVTSFQLPRALLAKLDEIKVRKRYRSRNKVALEALKYFVRKWDEEEGDRAKIGPVSGPNHQKKK